LRIQHNKTFLARPLRILMRNRPDTISHPGGDTVVMEQGKKGLESLGHTVDFDLEGKIDPNSYDLVHLFNLTLTDLIDRQTVDLLSHKIPYVIHSLQEDWPRFLNQCMATTFLMQKYIASGQNRARLVASLGLLKDCPTAEMPLSKTAQNASFILCTGKQELRFVKKYYSNTPTYVIPLGSGVLSSHPLADANSDFKKAFGLDEYILCVGRLEARKNQLMLLAALEDSDITLVFADGGFTYSPEYSDLCRKFLRRGKTIFTGRLSPGMLHSAYQNAKVYCTTSWYELPGLATLEGALYGSQLVASSWGTIEDYMGDSCRYVEPDDLVGIENQVLSAWKSLPNPELPARASKYSWNRTSKELESLYLKVLANSSRGP
jgi:glycosyltransferase involved in cell wall biosynthesis